MSSTRSGSTDTDQDTLVESKQWRKLLPYLFSITLPRIKVRQSVKEDGTTKDTNLLLITRSDGIHKIGYLPNVDKDIRLPDGSEARKAYLCKLGSILAAKAGISSGGNKIYDGFWDAVPEVLFGYEIFERVRGKVARNKASDLYVVGHPMESGSEALFRTPEEFAQHLLWLAEGDKKKDCLCVLCTKERKRKTKHATSENTEEVVESWRRDCNDRAQSYLSSTSLGGFWGDLPELSE
ncbi:hypothetical protein EPUS_08414 [Endocarpon pusillum Z07020]|uniref:Cryptic loci regulator 2 N-terminal domain-containing protein n=1 Tax=Endocarpon pusillum (strain Z07020 / HMAS-L-300199) TaxID=1263415 RepID=U1HNR5_ENDPU|nr:uncharacterized protein EPUS_08414 [Endocarpon pusillum Z07020]ERF72020.1 hypothetical protein EPUS_08414 [Endocarpon pusillum Z07020]